MEAHQRKRVRVSSGIHLEPDKQKVARVYLVLAVRDPEGCRASSELSETFSAPRNEHQLWSEFQAPEWDIGRKHTRTARGSLVCKGAKIRSFWLARTSTEQPFYWVQAFSDDFVLHQGVWVLRVCLPVFGRERELKEWEGHGARATCREDPRKPHCSSRNTTSESPQCFGGFVLVEVSAQLRERRTPRVLSRPVCVCRALPALQRQAVVLLRFCQVWPSPYTLHLPISFLAARA
jgi:hypothetical protein